MCDVFYRTEFGANERKDCWLDALLPPRLAVKNDLFGSLQSLNVSTISVGLATYLCCLKLNPKEDSGKFTSGSEAKKTYLGGGGGSWVTLPFLAELQNKRRNRRV